MVSPLGRQTIEPRAVPRDDRNQLALGGRKRVVSPEIAPSAAGREPELGQSDADLCTGEIR